MFADTARVTNVCIIIIIICFAFLLFFADLVSNKNIDFVFCVPFSALTLMVG